VDHVLEDGPEAARAVVDLRLVLGRQADHLGVAAALEVEDAAAPVDRASEILPNYFDFPRVSE
jgi:hypothetical protein